MQSGLQLVRFQPNWKMCASNKTLQNIKKINSGILHSLHAKEQIRRNKEVSSCNASKN